MDLVGYDREIFWEITDDFKSYQSNLDFQKVSSIPLSALCGDNVVERSPKTPWYTGPTLISFLESLEKNEEIKESFEEAGGDEFLYIPCLNDEPLHIGALCKIIDDNLAGWI